MIAEIVKQEIGRDGSHDDGGKECVERLHDVRSLTIPSSQGMVRLEGVLELLKDDDDVPPAAILNVREEIDHDPGVGGHINIQQPGRARHTALFERIELYADDAHSSRGSSVCGPDERWVRAVIPDELDQQVAEAVHRSTDESLRTIGDAIEQALEEWVAEQELSGGDA